MAKQKENASNARYHDAAWASNMRIIEFNTGRLYCVDGQPITVEQDATDRDLFKFTDHARGIIGWVCVPRAEDMHDATLQHEVMGRYNTGNYRLTRD